MNTTSKPTVITDPRAIPDVFRDSLPSGRIDMKDVKFVERKLLRFNKPVQTDHMSMVEEFQASVQNAPVGEPEGFEITLTSSASVVMPSIGQAICIRERNGAMRPVFMQVPTPGHLYDAQFSLKSVTKKKTFLVYTRIPHPRVPSMMVPKLKWNQEYVILNIYSSPYGVSYQVHTLDGIPEAITQTVEMYGTRDWHRKWIHNFTGQPLPEEERLSLRSKQYRALPLGVFTELYNQTYKEVQHAATVLPKEIRWSMSQLFAAACRMGGHDPYAGTLDAEYKGDPSLELSKESFFPYLAVEEDGQVVTAPIPQREAQQLKAPATAFAASVSESDPNASVSFLREDTSDDIPMIDEVLKRIDAENDAVAQHEQDIINGKSTTMWDAVIQQMATAPAETEEDEGPYVPGYEPGGAYAESEEDLVDVHR